MKFHSSVLTPSSARIMPWLVAVAFFMQMLDGTILNTALPSMGESLNVDPLRMQAVVVAYMLTTALLIPASGWMADRFGTRRIFVVAIFLFTLGSLLCALSTTLNFLVFSRIVQGVGGALMVPVGRLAILRAFPRYELVQMFSFITTPGLIGPLVGPTLGGFLVQYATWHWIFLINIPVGVVGCLLTFRYMPELKAENLARFDWQGFFFFSGGMVLITFAAEGFGELNLPRVQATLLCITGLILIALYWLRAAHAEHPLFPAHLFRTRSFTVGILGNLFSRLGSGAIPFLTPLFLQMGLGFSPFVAGMTMIPTAVAGIVGKNLVKPLLDRMGFRLFLTVNTALVGLLMSGFSLIFRHTSYVALLCYLGVFGVINSMQFTAMNSVTLIDLDDSEASSGNGMLSVVMQVASCTGVALAAAVLTGFTGGKDDLDPQQLMTAFHYTYLWVGAATLFTTVIFLQTPKNTGEALASPAAAPAADKTECPSCPAPKPEETRKDDGKFE